MIMILRPLIIIRNGNKFSSRHLKVNHGMKFFCFSHTWFAGNQVLGLIYDVSSWGINITQQCFQEKKIWKILIYKSFKRPELWVCSPAILVPDDFNLPRKIYFIQQKISIQLRTRFWFFVQLPNETFRL